MSRPQQSKRKRVPLRDKVAQGYAAPGPKNGWARCRRCDDKLEQHERLEGFCRTCLTAGQFWGPSQGAEHD